MSADSKPVKQEVNGTVILPPLVFPVSGSQSSRGPDETSRVELIEQGGIVGFKVRKAPLVLTLH